MLMPAKDMSDREREQWEDALSYDAFGTRQAKKNRSFANSLNRSFTSTAKKWRDYYSHDSGKCRIVIRDHMDAQRGSPDDAKRWAKAYLAAQLLPVNTLISQRSCKHENVTEEREERTRRGYGQERATWTEVTRTCTRCGLETSEEIDRTVEKIA